MMVAVEVYLKRDAAAEWKEWERRAEGGDRCGDRGQ
jgi:hypothetical protein